MTDNASPRLTLGVVLMLLGTVAAWGQPAAELQPIPLPDLAHLEPQVAEQLEQLREYTREMQNDPASSVAERAEAFGELGLSYHAYELQAPAQASYRNARQLAPSDPRWPHMLGYLHQQAGRLEEAESFYRQVLQIDPAQVAARIRLGRISLTQNRLEQAARLAHQALDREPNSTAAVALLGEVALAQGRFAQAVRHLRAALEAVPGANRLHYPLAMAYRNLGEQEQARSHLAQRGEVGVRPRDPLVDGLTARLRGERVYLLLGRMAFRAERYGEAAAAFARAVEERPYSVRARVNLGTSLALAGDRAGAAAQFREVLTVAPESANAHYNLGHLLLQEGVPDEAVEHLRAALRQRPADHQAHLLLAQALRRSGRPDEALAQLARVRELVPRHGAARLEESALLVQLGRYQEALQLLEQAHRAMPADGGLAHALARLLAGAPDPSLRDGARALDLATRVHQTQPSARHTETAAMALAETDRCDQAAQWQRRVLGQASENAPLAWLRELVAVLDHYENDRPCRYPTGGGVPPQPPNPPTDQ